MAAPGGIKKGQSASACDGISKTMGTKTFKPQLSIAKGVITTCVGDIDHR